MGQIALAEAIVVAAWQAEMLQEDAPNLLQLHLVRNTRTT